MTLSTLLILAVCRMRVIHELRKGLAQQMIHQVVKDILRKSDG